VRRKSVTPQIYENKKVCTADLSVRRFLRRGGRGFAQMRLHQVG